MGVTPRQLENLRQNCDPERSPAFSYMGQRVAYRGTDIAEWAKSELEAAQELYNARIARLSRANANPKAAA